MTMDALAVVEGYLDAIAAFDYERARSFLANSGFSFRSPISNFASADDFIAYLSLTGGIVQQMRRRKVFVDGQDVCHILDFVIQLSDKRTVPVAQWARVADGRIDSLELIYDGHEYHRLFERDPPEPGPVD
jgi:hypothetical protein